MISIKGSAPPVIHCTWTYFVVESIANDTSDLLYWIGEEENPSKGVRDEKNKEGTRWNGRDYVQTFWEATKLDTETTNSGDKSTRGLSTILFTFLASHHVTLHLPFEVVY